MDRDIDLDEAPFDELGSVYGELRHEVDALVFRDESVDSEYPEYPDPAALSVLQRRVLVRSIFSFVEALSFALRQVVVESDVLARLSPAEVTLARDQSFEVSSSGHVKQRSARIATLGGVRLTFNLAAKASASAVCLDTDSVGWQSLVASLAVRDRLTHPKQAQDLDVSDTEVRCAVEAFRWFDATIREQIAIMTHSMQAEIRDREAIRDV